MYVLLCQVNRITLISLSAFKILNKPMRHCEYVLLIMIEYCEWPKFSMELRINEIVSENKRVYPILYHQLYEVEWKVFKNFIGEKVWFCKYLIAISIQRNFFGRANYYLSGQMSLHPPNNLYKVTSLVVGTCLRCVRLPSVLPGPSSLLGAVVQSESICSLSKTWFEPSTFLALGKRSTLLQTMIYQAVKRNKVKTTPLRWRVSKFST